jgi:hypothetical protein
MRKKTLFVYNLSIHAFISVLLCAISCKIVTAASHVFQVLFSFQRK